MTKEIDFDKIVEEAERKFIKTAWEKIGLLTGQRGKDPLGESYLEKEIDKIIDDIEREKERVNPSRAIDHEEVWRATGKYMVFKKNCKR